MARPTPNPFIYDKPILDPNRFVGRGEEIQQVFSRLRAPEFESSSIVGERQSGKTSLLNYISCPDTIKRQGLDPDAYLFVYLDLSVIGPSTTPARFYEYMLGRLAADVRDYELEETLKEAGQQVRNGAYNLDGLFDRFDARGLHIALLFDDFHNIGNNPNFGLDFMYELRSLALDHKLAFITASRVDPSGLGHSDAVRSSPWCNIFSPVTLPPFSSEDIQELLSKYLGETELSSSDAELKRMLHSLAIHQSLALITSSLTEGEGNGYTDSIRSSPWLNIFSPITLSPFSRQDVDDMLKRYLAEAEVSFSSGEVKHILSLAGMAPCLLQMAFSFLLEAYQRGMEEALRLAVVMRRFLEASSHHWDGRWQSSSQKERAALALLTILASERKGQLSYWKSAQLETWCPKVEEVLDGLKERGLVSGSHGRYVLASPSLYQWVAKELTEPANELDMEELGVYRRRLEASLPDEKVSSILDWLRDANTKHRGLFASWIADSESSGEVFDLLAKSNLGFHGTRPDTVNMDVPAARISNPSSQVQMIEAEERPASPLEFESQPPQGAFSENGLVSILFTDLEGSTELLNRLGDDGNQELLRVHNGIIRDSITRHSGREVKTMGDGFMIVFPHPKDAASCAIETQRHLKEYNEERGDSLLKVRMGINAGDAIEEDGDFFGNAVVLAARVMSKASGGQILTSEQFRKLSNNEEGLPFRDWGWKRLKGFDLRQHIYELHWMTEAQ